MPAGTSHPINGAETCQALALLSKGNVIAVIAQDEGRSGDSQSEDLTADLGAAELAFGPCASSASTRGML